MKFLLSLIFLFPSAIIAQKNELKTNLLKIPEISYERRLTHHFSAGVHAGTALYKLSDDTQNRIFLKTFGRWYVQKNQDFSKFFLQLSFMYNREEYFPSSDPSVTHRVGMYDEAGLLAGIGYKFVIKERFTVDVYGDVGADFLHPDSLLPVLADAGLNLGYRF